MQFRPVVFPLTLKKTQTPNAGDKRQSVQVSEVRGKKGKKQGEKKNCEEDRRGIDLFLTANQFNNSVNGEAQWVWGQVNGMGWRWWWWWGGLKSQVDTLPYFVYEHRMPLTILLSVPGFSQKSSYFSQGRVIPPFPGNVIFQLCVCDSGAHEVLGPAANPEGTRSVNVIKCHFTVRSADMEKLLFSSSTLL